MAKQPQKHPVQEKTGSSSGRRPRRDVQWRWGFVIALLLIIVTSSTAVGVSIHMENNDGFCASCHTEPETTFVQVAQAVQSGQAQPEDLASFHAGEETTCIQCHSGKGINGRISALQLGARDMIAYVRNNYPQPSPLTHPIPDANCLKCHQDVTANRSFDNHYHLFLKRWQDFAPDKSAKCVDCHTTHTKDGSVEIGFLNQDRTVKECESCHRVMGD